MKIIKLDQVLGLAAKSSTLLVIALLSFQPIECKSDKNSQKNPRIRVAPVRNKPAAVVEVAENNEDYSKTIKEKPLKKSEHVQPSVDVTRTQLEDGSVVEVKTTVTPIPQEGKVVTTTEKWEFKDYAKAVAIGAAALGAVGLGIAYRDQITEITQNAPLGQSYKNSKMIHVDELDNQSTENDGGFPSLTAEQQAKLEALDVSGGYIGKSEAEKIQKMTIAEQQKALDDIKNIEDETRQLRQSSAVVGAALTPLAFYTIEGAIGAVKGVNGAKEAFNIVPGMTNLTRAEQAKYMQTFVKEGARSAARASLRSPALYGFATGQFLYDNIDPATSQASIDATDRNIDAGELYQ